MVSQSPAGALDQTSAAGAKMRTKSGITGSGKWTDAPPRSCAGWLGAKRRARSSRFSVHIPRGPAKPLLIVAAGLSRGRKLLRPPPFFPCVAARRGCRNAAEGLPSFRNPPGRPPSPGRSTPDSAKEKEKAAEFGAARRRGRFPRRERAWAGAVAVNYATRRWIPRRGR
jgi:hypothetical protein